jgi:hypothetical protein
MSINLTDYNRSGVFIEERNSSTIDRAAPQEIVINFVPGFSRKGTVFNRPVLIKSKNDRLAYFGDIDRFLENKGSFFHRTIDVALQTAPVFAMNLLKTNSLDTLNYATVSVAAQYDNDPIASRLYDDFFNKAGFWQRDTESFLNFAQDSDKMIHFTNVSDKKISLFMFKSSKTGFDITAETWYGGKDKVPTWMNYNDYISDYMVRVVVVNGDWSNYTTLAADTNWSKYFNASGLRKGKISNFISDRAVTLLGDYNGSLIPYFRDNQNNNIFIETLINLDTDITGLFCAFDINKVETDFHNGNVDIIGETLTGLDKSKINFMSYQDTIEETDVYDNMPLDKLGNVIGINTIVGRTSLFGNGHINGLSFTPLSGNIDPALAPHTITATGGTAIINNTVLNLTNTNLVYTAIPAPVTNTMYRIDTMYIDVDGSIKTIMGTPIELANSITEITAVATGLTYPAAYPNNAIILGYHFRSYDGTLYDNNYITIAHDGSSFINVTVSAVSGDILVNNTLSTNILELNFADTASATKANYRGWRNLQFFNELVTKKVLSNSVIIDAVGVKVDLTNVLWIDNYSSVGTDKQITITVDPIFDIQNPAASGNFIFYYNDNEFKMGTAGLETRNEITGTANYGVAAKNSEFYLDYYNGMINTGDYFFVKIGLTTSFKFIHYTDLFNPASIGDYIIMTIADATTLGLSPGANNLNILIDNHPVNKGKFSISAGESFGTLAGFAEGLETDGYLLAGEIAFSVAELVATYTTVQTIDIFNYDLKVYLKMYTLGQVLKVEFMADNTLITPYIIPGGLLSINTTIIAYSGEASYEQTLEIETHPTYTITDNKVLIDLVRYPEVKIGDYVKAYIDNSLLQPGEYPKKFARILKKTPWIGNAINNVQYAEITTDTKIDISIYGVSDLQTTRYTKIEDYIDTYKAITLNGFIVQAASIPNNTEARQTQILDVIGNTTALYNAIVNKNKFNFRYLIDSFGLGLTEFSKQQLADITGKRKNAIAFLNMPSVKSFKSSSNPSFINTDGTLNLEHVKNGGNLEQNPAFLYSLAQGSGTDDGRDTVGYFFPYVSVNDNGRPLLFPPAAYVANTYMRKINSAVSGIYNWTVAAGTEDGIILGIANTEMDFTEFDLEQMYAMGINPISYAKNVGFYIETEFTASTETLSALSFLHVREILIDLENELFAMLLKYQWKFNTPAVRAKIKREADAICQKYVDRSALFAFENIIDDSNNTPNIIDNQFGLLETYIEPVKSMGTIVNVINIMATGAIGNSSGFTA